MAVNQERVNVVCNELTSGGKKATLAAVRDALGEGSYSTIGPMVQKWKAGRGEVAGNDAVAVSVPDVVATAGGKLLAEVWALAERAAGERLAAERAAMDAERAAMAAELETAYGELESLREELGQAKSKITEMAEINKKAGDQLMEAAKAMNDLRVLASEARAEAGAFKLAIEKFNPVESGQAPKKPAPSKKGGRVIGKSNTEPVDTKTAPLAL